MYNLVFGKLTYYNGYAPMNLLWYSFKISDICIFNCKYHEHEKQMLLTGLLC